MDVFSFFESPKSRTPFPGGLSPSLLTSTYVSLWGLGKTPIAREMTYWLPGTVLVHFESF